MSPDKPESAKVEREGMFFYIQNVGFQGNCIKFWRPNGHGYTCNLDEAWKVTEAEAQNICHSRPKEDIPWPAEKVDRFAHRHLDVEALRAIRPSADPQPQSAPRAIRGELRQEGE